MVGLETITPEELAIRTGWSLRRVKATARGLGACRILGNRMVLTASDVAIIFMATMPNVTKEDVFKFLNGDVAELLAEADYQGRKEPTGVVYFIGRGNQIKIGFTNNLPKRMAQFRTATTEPFKVLLTIPATPILESYFHEKFAKHRSEREWFRDAEEITLFIARRMWRK